MRWDDSLLDVEAATRSKLSMQLARCEGLLAHVAEIAYHAPRLPPKQSSESDTDIVVKNAAFLFLRRVVGQLRAMWLLLVTGYTAEGGILCASVIEHALVVGAIAKDPAKAEALLNAELKALQAGDVLKRLPWSVRQLCAPLEADADLRDGTLYDFYRAACQAKHPSLRRAHDEAFARTAADGTFSVAPTPDDRDEDVLDKRRLVFIAHYFSAHALKAIGEHFRWQRNDAYFNRYLEEVGLALAENLKELRALTNQHDR